MGTLEFVTNVTLYCVISIFSRLNCSQFLENYSSNSYGLFPLPDSDLNSFRLRHGFLYSADFSIGSDSDSKMRVIGTEIFP